MTQSELIEYLARVESNLRTDLEEIEHTVQQYTDLTEHGVRLSWQLAHLQGSFTDFHRDLERLQKELQRGVDAGNS